MTKTLYTVFTEGERISGYRADPIFTVLGEYAQEDFEKFRKQADEFVIKVTTVQHIETFGGPFTGMHSRHHEDVKYLEIEDSQILIKDGEFFGVVLDTEWRHLLDKEPPDIRFGKVYLTHGGCTAVIYDFIETEVYGHDGEEDSEEIEKFASVERKADIKE